MPRASRYNPTTGTKQCSCCLEEKPASDYSKCARNAGGICAHCKACAKKNNARWRAENKATHRASSKAWYRANRDRCRANQAAWSAKNKDKIKAHSYRHALNRKYGLTPEQHAAMFEAQDHKCAICGKRAKRLMIDHCHDTGLVRELLCQSCNVAVGLMGDSVQRLRLAIAYIEKHQNLWHAAKKESRP